MLYTGLSLVMTPTGPTYKGVLQLKATFIDVNHIYYLDLYGSVLFLDIQVQCRCKTLIFVAGRQSGEYFHVTYTLHT